MDGGVAGGEVAGGSASSCGDDAPGGKPPALLPDVTCGMAVGLPALVATALRSVTCYQTVDICSEVSAEEDLEESRGKVGEFWMERWWQRMLHRVCDQTFVEWACERP